MEHDISHEQITRIAEELADQLARDREELINFVYEALKGCYDEDPDSFLEDWESYVGE